MCSRPSFCDGDAFLDAPRAAVTARRLNSLRHWASSTCLPELLSLCDVERKRTPLPSTRGGVRNAPSKSGPWEVHPLTYPPEQNWEPGQLPPPPKLKPVGVLL